MSEKLQKVSLNLDALYRECGSFLVCGGIIHPYRYKGDGKQCYDIIQVDSDASLIYKHGTELYIIPKHPRDDTFVMLIDNYGSNPVFLTLYESKIATKGKSH